MSNFRQVLTVTGFTFRDAVRKKSFWVTNFIYIILVVGACVLVPMLTGGSTTDVDDLQNFSTSAGISDESTYVGPYYSCTLIEDGTFPGAQQALEDMGLRVTLSTAARREDALDEVREDSANVLIEIAAQNDLPAITITQKDVMSSFPVGTVYEGLNTAWRQLRFAQLGYDAAQTAEVLGASLPLQTAAAAGSSLSNMVVGMALMLLMFMTIYVYGYGVAMSVATEKSTRVMETLIVSAKPSRILLGKCVGMGLVGLSQLAGVLLLGFASIKFALPAGGLGGGISLPDLTVGRALLLVVYFLMGYALFSMINSMCGSMVSRMEDLQSAMMPAALVSVFSFYGGYFTMSVGTAMGGSGEAGKFMLLLPFTAPYAAPGMLLEGTASPALIAASLAILSVTIALVAWVSGKVYAASVLHYGSKLKFGDLRRMIKGN
ncbi:MAG: ABC transporter permease [Oscillospiraceae bacterium]|jgi:ABC-2 type transport system permease protein|nr:ABC transporter permease [Oscillospiraceae bacterium]